MPYLALPLKKIKIPSESLPLLAVSKKRKVPPNEVDRFILTIPVNVVRKMREPKIFSDAYFVN